MGIINVTPDSFSDGGSEFLVVEKAVAKSLEMEQAGVDIIDIGGESSRPGAKPVSLEEEIKRVVPVIEAIRSKSDIPISIDTTKSEVAFAAIKAGANVVNDISAGMKDENMFPTLAALRIPIVLMHMRGDPQTMTKLKASLIVYTSFFDSRYLMN
jgi:dihydropteroate synthase